MNEVEYNKLVEDREIQKRLLAKATLPKHKLMIQNQLDNIRLQLKDAHANRYRESTTQERNP